MNGWLRARETVAHLGTKLLTDLDSFVDQYQHVTFTPAHHHPPL